MSATFSFDKKELKKLSCFFSDIDGTLLDSKSEISPLAIQEIKKLSHKIPFFLCSGRNPKGMKKIKDALGLTTPLISLNGALISDDKHIIYSEPLDRKASSDIIYTLLVQFGDSISIEGYDAHKWYCNTTDNQYFAYEAKVLGFQPDVIFKDVSFLDEVELNKILVIASSSVCDEIMNGYRFYREKVQIIRNHDTYIEIVPLMASKGNGITKAMEALNLDKSHSLAVGDSSIDLSMFEAAHYKIAMGNADHVIKNASNAIIDKNDDDGLAKLVKEINLQMAD